MAGRECRVLWWNVSPFFIWPLTSSLVGFHAVTQHAFWLYRHVEKTGLIKNLIITEESGIAKGIRRVIAVTGTEAQEVTRTAVALEAELAAIERKSGKEKDAAMKVFSTVSIRFLIALCGIADSFCSW